MVCVGWVFSMVIIALWFGVLFLVSNLSYVGVLPLLWGVVFVVDWV